MVSLVILHENAAFVLGLEDWALAAVVRALVLAQDTVAAQAMVPEAHDIVAAQAMAMVLAAHHHGEVLGEGANLPRAREVSRLWLAAAEAPVDHHHQDVTDVDHQFRMEAR